jgi:hypothetical protein
MLQFAEGAFNEQLLQKLLFSLKKDVDRCMEHLRLGRFARDMESVEGLKKCGPIGSKGKGLCGDAILIPQSELRKDALAHCQKPGCFGLVYQRRNPKLKAH